MVISPPLKARRQETPTGHKPCLDLDAYWIRAVFSCCLSPLPVRLLGPMSAPNLRPFRRRLSDWQDRPQAGFVQTVRRLRDWPQPLSTQVVRWI